VLFNYPYFLPQIRISTNQAKAGLKSRFWTGRRLRVSPITIWFSPKQSRGETLQIGGEAAATMGEKSSRNRPRIIIKNLVKPS